MAAVAAAAESGKPRRGTQLPLLLSACALLLAARKAKARTADAAIGEPFFVDADAAQILAPYAEEDYDDHALAPLADYEGEFELAITRRNRWRRRRGRGRGGGRSVTNVISMPAPPPPPPAPPAVVVSAAYQTEAARQAQAQGGVVSSAASRQQQPQDCVWGEWTAWTPCSGAPGQEGLRYRQRTKIVQEQNGGACQGTAQQAQRCLSASAR